MYDVIFKITIEPFTKLREMDKSRKHTFINYMKRHLAGYQMYKYNFERISDDFLYIVKNVSLNNKNDIEEYNKLVDKFKLFVYEEYDKISKYCVNANIVAYMGVYNKEAYEKNEEVEWDIQMYLNKNNIMPNYDTILQQYCEVKTYDPKNKTIKSEFISYEEIKNSIKFRLDYDTFHSKKLIELPIKYIRSMFKDEFHNGITTIFFGREEMVNGYTPKYKLGDIVEYEGKISIIRHAPNAVEQYKDELLNTRYMLDYIIDGWYGWTDMDYVTDCDLKPYTGEVPEFIKLLQKAVLKQDGYSINRKNYEDIDYLLRNYKVIIDFDKFKDELIELLKRKGEPFQ